jgi:hypothetical protein
LSTCPIPLATCSCCDRLADSDDEVFVPRIPNRSFLAPCVSDDELFILALCFLVPPSLPVPLFSLSLHRWLVAIVNALLGMAGIDLLLLLLLFLLLQHMAKDRVILGAMGHRGHLVQYSWQPKQCGCQSAGRNVWREVFLQNFLRLMCLKPVVAENTYHKNETHWCTVPWIICTWQRPSESSLWFFKYSLIIVMLHTPNGYF